MDENSSVTKRRQNTAKKMQQKNSVASTAAPKKQRQIAADLSKKNAEFHFPYLHLVAAFFVFSLTVFGLFFGNTLINRIFSQYPIETVKVIGEFRFIERQKLEKVLNIYLTDNFFQVDLNNVREQAEALPWIEQAWVKKSWPDTVELILQERKPLASWGDSQLISERKEIFDGERVNQLGALPVLYGADDYASLVVDRYLEMNTLFSQVGLTIKTLELEERFSWRVAVSEGITFVISEERCLEKLKGFVGLYQKMPEVDKPYIKQVDLRYDNGLAIKWKKKNGNSNAA